MTKNQERELFTTLGKLVTGINVIQSDVTEIRVTQADHSRVLDEHSRVLDEHSRVLDEHSRVLDEHSSRFAKLETAVALGSGRQNDLIPRVVEIQKTVNRISEVQSDQTFKIIEMLNRLNVVEIQQRALKVEIDGLNSDVMGLKAAIHSLIDPIQIGWDLRGNIADIDRRLSVVEEKLA